MYAYLLPKLFLFNVCHSVASKRAGCPLAHKFSPSRHRFHACRQGLNWEITPQVGILETGSNESVSIKGTLNDTLNGLIQSQFKVTNLGSGEVSYAKLNTTFYYCSEVRSLEECVVRVLRVT